MMSTEERFSFETFLSSSSQRNDSVVVIGVMYEEGAFYVVDPSPSRSARIMRIRKADIVDTKQCRHSTAEDETYQFHRVFVKKGAPVIVESIMSAEQAAAQFARPRDNAITAFFLNDGELEEYWTVEDAHNGATVISRRLFQPNEQVQATLTTDDAGYGEAKFIHDGQPAWTDKDFISDGDIVSMF